MDLLAVEEEDVDFEAEDEDPLGLESSLGLEEDEAFLLEVLPCLDRDELCPADGLRESDEAAVEPVPLPSPVADGRCLEDVRGFFGSESDPPIDLILVWITSLL